EYAPTREKETGPHAPCPSAQTNRHRSPSGASEHRPRQSVEHHLASSWPPATAQAPNGSSRLRLHGTPSLSLLPQSKPNSRTNDHHAHAYRTRNEPASPTSP